MTYVSQQGSVFCTLQVFHLGFKQPTALFNSPLVHRLCAAGFTGLTVGLVNTHYVYLPIPVVIQAPRKVSPSVC